jgi:putative mRNA 3-end processing factor
MRVRGMRRRRAVDRGFVISDHADWSGLLDVVRDSEAEKIRVTHGYAGSMARYLTELGWDATPLETQFHGEQLDEEADGDADAVGVDAEVEGER